MFQCVKIQVIKYQLSLIKEKSPPVDLSGMANQTLLTQLMPLVLETVEKAPHHQAAVHLRVVAAMILPATIQAVIDFHFVVKLFHTNLAEISRVQTMQNKCS